MKGLFGSNDFGGRRTGSADQAVGGDNATIGRMDAMGRDLSKKGVELVVIWMVRVADDLTNVEGAENIELSIELGEIPEMGEGLKSLRMLVRWTDAIDDGFIYGEGGG